MKLELVAKALDSPTNDLELLCALARTLSRAIASKELGAMVAKKAIEAKLIPKLAALLEIDSDPLCLDCMWALGNLESVSSECVREICGLKLHLKVLALMRKKPDHEIQERGLFFLANMAGENCAEMRDELWGSELIPILTEITGSQKVDKSLLRAACWCLSNLFRSRSRVPLDKVQLLVCEEMLRWRRSRVAWETFYMSRRNRW